MMSRFGRAGHEYMGKLCERIHAMLRHSSLVLTFVSFTLGFALLLAFLLFLGSSDQLVRIAQ